MRWLSGSYHQPIGPASGIDIRDIPRKNTWIIYDHFSLADQTCLQKKYFSFFLASQYILKFMDK
jgi:hypothetical protein